VNADVSPLPTGDGAVAIIVLDKTSLLTDQTHDILRLSKVNLRFAAISKSQRGKDAELSLKCFNQNIREIKDSGIRSSIP
jgi:hypothetical protein